MSDNEHCHLVKSNVNYNDNSNASIAKISCEISPIQEKLL